jgi:hypothetical protein
MILIAFSWEDNEEERAQLRSWSSIKTSQPSTPTIAEEQESQVIHRGSIPTPAPVSCLQCTVGLNFWPTNKNEMQCLHLGGNTGDVLQVLLNSLTLL